MYVYHGYRGKACILTCRSSQTYNIISMDRDDSAPRHFLASSGYPSMLDDGEYTGIRLGSDGGSTIVYRLDAVLHCCDQGAHRTSLGLDEFHSSVIVRRLIGASNRSYGAPNVDQNQVAHSNPVQTDSWDQKDLGSYNIRWEDSCTEMILFTNRVCQALVACLDSDSEKSTFHRPLFPREQSTPSSLCL